MLDLLPAVDVAQGRVIWSEPQHGVPGSHPDPVAMALRWEAAGARWIHLVDLDRAYRRGSNLAVLSAVINHLRIPVELSGGISDDAALDAALLSGAARVVLATVSLEDRVWVAAALQRYGPRLAVGLDVAGGSLAPRGLGRSVGELFETLAWLNDQRCARIVLVDTRADGSLAGPNLPLVTAVAAVARMPMTVAGGIARVGDLHLLAQVAGVDSVIVGKALYSGHLSLEEALRAARTAG